MRGSRASDQADDAGSPQAEERHSCEKSMSAHRGYAGVSVSSMQRRASQDPLARLFGRRPCAAAEGRDIVCRASRRGYRYSRKRSESLQQFPVSVTALRSAQLETAMLGDASSLASKVPNLQVQVKEREAKALRCERVPAQAPPRTRLNIVSLPPGTCKSINNLPRIDNDPRAKRSSASSHSARPQHARWFSSAIQKIRLNAFGALSCAEKATLPVVSSSSGF